jgi:hypothetical protein
LATPNLQRARFAQQRNESRLAITLAVLSIAALLYCYAHQQLLLYGDAVAHLNIARRVVDNRHPLESYGQLGTVWLPLQHIAMLPFVWIDTLWRSGIAGAIPGMLAFVLGSLGIFRLVSARLGTMPGYVAAAIYALNPNLLYMQATAMNEPICLAFFLWAIVYLDEFIRGTTTLGQDRSSSTAAAKVGLPALGMTPGKETGLETLRLRPRQALEYCGICMAGGALTRYDGWFSAAILGVILFAGFLRWRRRAENPLQRRAMTKSFLEVLFLNALVPVYWLIYTWAISGNALDFINGPYSAKAIALRSTARGAPPYPGQNHVFTAGLYFLKSAQLNMGTPAIGRILLLLALAGTAIAIWRFRRFGILLLLWIPLAFYGLSIAYGSVPIYIPVWYPFSYYNVRYGLELLPVFAVFPVILVSVLAEKVTTRSLRVAIWSALLVGLVGSGYVSAYAESPITLREARVNSRDRIALEDGLASALEHLPPSSTLLMYEAEHAGAVREAGIPLRHVISESEHPDWELALADPSHQADYAVACKGDPVWLAVRQHQAEFADVVTISAPGQAICTVYTVRTR